MSALDSPQNLKHTTKSARLPVFDIRPWRVRSNLKHIELVGHEDTWGLNALIHLRVLLALMLTLERSVLHYKFASSKKVPIFFSNALLQRYPGLTVPNVSIAHLFAYQLTGNFQAAPFLVFTGSSGYLGISSGIMIVSSAKYQQATQLPLLANSPLRPVLPQPARPGQF
jgi:hypothetical protein